MRATSLASSPLTRLVLGLAALQLVIVFGTAGYMVIEGWSLLDAFYMAVITITTVGYREVHPLDSEGQLFTALLLFLGVGVAFYILTVMVATIIEGDLGQLFGARRMRNAIQRLHDHYIVCGFGRVGQEIARELNERKLDFVVLDRDEAAVERGRRAGYVVLQGDATGEASLLEAGLARCRALIAASDSDATNTYITLTARALRPDAFVVARVSTPDFESKLRQAGASRVISPYAIGGKRLALAAIQPMITDFIDIVDASPPDALGERILAEFVIDEASGLAGRKLAEVLAGCRDVVPLAVRDAAGRMLVGPAGSTLLSTGDRLLVAGPEDELRRVSDRR